MKYNAIFTDFKIPQNWQFSNELNNNGEDWRIINKINNFKTDSLLKKIKRYTLFFSFPFIRFLNRKKYDKIIAWQQFYGIAYAFYCRIFHVKKVNKLVVMTFIFKERKGVLGKIYKKWVEYSINSVYIDKVICFSSNELTYYSKIFPQAKEKFEFVKYGLDKPYTEINPKKGDYFVTSGKSNRDYNFLINSFKNIEDKLKIISYTSPPSKSENVEVFSNVFEKEYYKYLADSFAVIISLDDENISSGQLVFIHAMQLAKPIICTYSKSLSDYIIDGYNGYIIQKNESELFKAIEKLKDNKLYDEISKKSYEMYLQNFSTARMAKDVIKIFNNIKGVDGNEDSNVGSKKNTI